MRRVTPRLVSMGLAALLCLGGCGGDSGGSADSNGSQGTSAASGEGTIVDVTARDFEFDPADIKVPSGKVTIRFKNEGTVPHTFTLEDNASVDTGNVQPGEAKTITFDAPTEEMDFICTIHYESNNMEGHIGPE